nr:zinc finger, CCHC-type, retrotransposon Gag domain protein [Tanacetum cinerariifolium]
QNALQALLPQILEEIREEFRTGSGSSNASGNPTPVTIHTWLERFNKQKPHSFEKATAPVDAENWISHMENIFDVMGCEDAFKTRLATSTETSTEFMLRFLRLAGFLGAAAGTEEEQAKNFQWG